MSKVLAAKDAFRNAIHALTNGENLPEETEEETTDADPAAGAPDKESSPDPDKSDDESSDEETSEQADKESDKSGESDSETEESEDQGGDEDTADEPDEDGSQVITIDGEEVTLEQVREWRKDGLRQSDYTRKTQETAATKAALEARDRLAADIVGDESFSQFLAANPQALPGLLADPENTRALLGNPEEVQALWDDYDLIKDNPRLAERFHGKPEDAQEKLESQREADNIQAIANYLDTQVDEIAKGFEGVEADEVRDYVLKLGRVPVGDNVDPNEVVSGFGRLFTLMFVEGEDGNYALDETLIRNRFEQLSTAAATAASSTDEDADEHNAEVDAKLKDAGPPASKGGDAPAPGKEKLEPAKDLNEVIHGLLGYGGK